MTKVPTVTLNDGYIIPQLGLGVWQIPADGAASVVREALLSGYRSIDTAAIYGNEEGVGSGIAESGIARAELFITTKIWNSHQGYDETLAAFEESMSRLGLDYLDMLLIHWPVPQRNLYVDTWRAFIKLREEGRVKSIGVSNFNVPHLQRLLTETGVAPVLNQIELHPRLQQRELRKFHAANGIETESWSPLGSGTLLGEPILRAIAEKYGKSTAQIIIRWHLDNGLIVIPKSVTPARIKQNIDVFDFHLDNDDMARIAALDADGRIGPNPNEFYLP